MSDNKLNIKISKAKGRPMLHWIGKRPIEYVTSFPSQHIETFDATNEQLARPSESEVWTEWSERYPKGGLLFHGDNKEVLAHLLASGFRGKVNLIYIDPPFDSGADYVRKVKLRGVKGAAKIEGETYSLGEQIQYTDIWANDNYLQFMYERLLLLKELLAEDGTVWVHCDWHKSHHLRCLCDEVFGSDNFLNEVIWRYVKFQMGGMSRFANNSDRLLVYRKSKESWTFNPIKFKLKESKELLVKGWDKESGTIQNIKDENGRTQKMEVFDEKIDDVWDVQYMGAPSNERTSYPTQKPQRILERVILASSNPGDIVLDCFVGSGTTAYVAQQLGRRWIACDINKGAIQTTSKRLQRLIQDQIKGTVEKSEVITTSELEKNADPCQYSFTVHRVNDYDLTIQHNEAVNLVCEHIGVQRTYTDSFFDGTWGTKLVKIVPLTHPLTPLDLEEIKKELDARPEEDRSIAVICLGKELAADDWLAEWNKFRAGDNAVNRIEVIELRSDPKYGKFMVHDPAQAKVSFIKENGKVCVTIDDFISPTIVERLNMDFSVFQAKITDWRSMVDCIMIDTNYNGDIFNIVVSDVPKKKNDVVEGSYEVSVENGATIAVKIIDMLGEEVIVTHKL